MFIQPTSMTYTRGEHVVQVFTLGVNITGWSLAALCVRRPGLTPVFTRTTAPGDGIEIIDGPTGQFSLTLPYEITSSSSVPAGEYVVEIWRTDVETFKAYVYLFVLESSFPIVGPPIPSPPVFPLPYTDIGYVPSGVLLGRYSSGAGIMETITVGANLALSLDGVLSGAGGTPGGVPGNLQFNNGSTFDGAAFSVVSTSGVLLRLTSQAAADTPLAIQRHASQSARPFTIYDSNGTTVLAGFSADCRELLLPARPIIGNGNTYTAATTSGGAVIGANNSLTNAATNGAVIGFGNTSSTSGDAAVIGNQCTASAGNGVAVVGYSCSLSGASLGVVVGALSSVTGGTATVVGRSCTTNKDSLVLGTSITNTGSKAVLLGANGFTNSTDNVIIFNTANAQMPIPGAGSIVYSTETGNPSPLYCRMTNSGDVRAISGSVNSWADPADGTRKGRRVESIWDTAEREVARDESDGSRGYKIFTVHTTAPSDSMMPNGSLAFYTDGSGDLKIKIKDSGGTVRTGTVDLGP